MHGKKGFRKSSRHPAEAGAIPGLCSMRPLQDKKPRLRGMGEGVAHKTATFAAHSR
jgi:hypothetical protein